MSLLTGAVIRRPVVAIVLTVLVTAILGAFATQAVTEDGVAVDNEVARAADRLDDLFGEPQTVLQILVRSTDGTDIRGTDGLAASQAVQEAIADSPAADTLIDDGRQPPIASYLGGAEEAIRAAGLDAASLSDDDVRELQGEAAENLPAEVADLFDGLVADRDPADTGLILAFQDTAGLDEDAIAERQRMLVTAVQSADLPDGFLADALSLGLLLDGSDIGPEVGRLFGTAMLIILGVLAVVYWVRPPARQRGRIVRRTAADVGLTLLVILMAVVWMQGTGVLLGPDYADLIGYFSPQTQIVPILVIGLGVDFAIHLLARYRGDAGGGSPPDAAFATAGTTVGRTLALCTAATAIGFLTNLVSPVDFLATLGVLAAVGIAAAFALTMTFLPAARLLLDRRAARTDRLPVTALGAQREALLPRSIGRASWLAIHAPLITLVVALGGIGAGAWGFTQLDSEFNLTDFVPQDDPQLAVFEALDEAFDGGFDESTEVLLTGELATPAAHNALVAAIEDSAQVPGVQTLGGDADATAITSVLRDASDDRELAADLAEAGLNDDLTVEEGADVDAIFDRAVADIAGADEVIARDGGDWVGRVELRTNAGQDDAVMLRDDLRAAFAPVASEDVTGIPTSPQIVQGGIAEDIERSQITSLLVALGAAMGLLVVFFAITVRRGGVGVLTILPVGLVLALTFGTMALTGIPLNPVTATLAALSIGIGVPFTIHVTSRFLEEREHHADGATAMRATLAQTGGALAGSALTTAIGFGVLTTATLVPFEQLGYVIVYAIAYSLVAAILVLPSLLILWDRRDRRAHPPSDALRHGA